MKNSKLGLDRVSRLPLRDACWFGEFQFDPSARVLYDTGKPVHLTPKTLDTLAVLLMHAGRVVSKQFLLETIWPDQFVDEVNLPQQISLLRKALREGEGGQEYIHTYPGKGYGFVCPVRWEAHAIGSDAGESRATRGSLVRFWLIAALIVTTVVLAVLIGLWRTSRTEIAQLQPVLKRFPLVRLPGAKFHPALSADGEKTAFVWDRGEGLGICVYTLSRSSEPILVAGSCGNPSSPCWSPDGQWLAYLRHNSQANELIVTGHGEEHVVQRLYPMRDLLAQRMLDWSPDGKWVAASDKVEPSQPLSIYLISPETGEKRLLYARDDFAGVGDVDPRFSPSGDTVAFVRFRSRLRKDIMAVSSLGGVPRLLSPDHEKVGGVGWSPGDPACVLFSSNQEGDHRLYRLNVNHPGSKPVRDLSGLYGGNPLQFSVSARARRMAYVAAGDDLNIWRLDLAAPRNLPSRWKEMIASTGEDSAPQYSPDGNRICFISDRSGNEQLWVSDSDGSRPVQLTKGSLRPGLGRWSPDGKLIVFNGIDRKVYVVPSSGGEVRPLALGHTFGLVGFSREPGWLLGVCDGQIARIPVEGGAALRLTSGGGHYAITSPDGSIFYTRGRMLSEIRKVAARGGKEILVTNRLVPGCFACWTPAREGVYYLREDDPGGTMGLYLMDFHLRKDVLVSAVPQRMPPLGTEHMSLSPDGRYLLMVRRDWFSSDLYLVKPFE